MPLLSRRELIAAALAPLAAPVGYWLGLTMFGLARWLRQREGFGLAAPSVAELVRPLGLVLMVGAPIAWAAALAGLPIYMVVRGGGGQPLGGARRLTLLAVAAALGALVALLMKPHLGRDLFRIPFPPWAGALLGLVVAVAFLRLLDP